MILLGRQIERTIDTLDVRQHRMETVGFARFGDPLRTVRDRFCLEPKLFEHKRLTSQTQGRLSSTLSVRD